MSPDNPIDFIKLLKSQHKFIVSTVYEIDNQPSGPSDLNISIEKLNRITDILFDHLELEDKQLYPILLANKDTSNIAIKYSYDMERLSCIAIDFFKRYCVNKEGLKIFVEDFINGYSVFKGLLKVRIKREETELYPAFILLQSGVMYSDVLSYVQEKETESNNSKKSIFLLGQNEASKLVLSLALEMSGYDVNSTYSPEKIPNFNQTSVPDLILIDVSKVNKELSDLIMHLRSQIKSDSQLVGYSTTEAEKLDENVKLKLDHFIPKAAFDIEQFSERVKSILIK